MHGNEVTLIHTFVLIPCCFLFKHLRHFTHELFFVSQAVGREMLIQLIYHLLNNYGKNDTLTKFLDETSVHIMVTMNPDGFQEAYDDANGGEKCFGYTGRYRKLECNCFYKLKI